MQRICPRLARSLAAALLAAAALVQETLAVDIRDRDARNIRTGHPIPVEGYCDQPYVVVNRDGSWLCTLTTAGGHEGAKGEHMVATRSTDQGKTWSPLVDIEPADGPSSSYGSPIVTPSGRVYCVYCYNGDRLAAMPDGKPLPRADMLGWFVLKWSDDGGRTWSRERRRLPMRVTACDRANDWKGAVQIFWGIDKPKAVGTDLFFAFTKLGKYMLDNGEGWVYRSDNLLTEPDPAKIRWDLLPEGDHGIRAPQFGSVQEEHNLVPLADGKSLYCVYRTTTGYPCHAYSRDGGRAWTTPEHMTYAPGGRKVKTPRACPKLWKTANGKYLFWFHNHSGRTFDDRNPAWIAGGVEIDGFLHWSQPEILLYDPDPKTRMSYPDLVEQSGRFWVTETQKTIARVHEIDPKLLEGLWGQLSTARQHQKLREVPPPVLDVAGGKAEAQVPTRVDAMQSGGLTLDLWLTLSELSPGQALVVGDGLALTTTGKGAVQIELSDGKARFVWDCDAGLLSAGTLHHIVVTLDAGPHIVTFVVDGVLCDGGAARQFGWARYPETLAPSLPAALKVGQAVRRLRVYGRCLRTSEAVANYAAGL